MNEIINLSRRDFLQKSTIISSSLLLGLYLPQTGQAKSHADVFAPNAFLRIDRTGAVTFMLNKAEMGQGVYTSLPVILAEELECRLQDIKVEHAPVDPAYDHTMYGPIMVTGGSTSVRSEWDRLRQAGAAARMMLIGAAAQKWRVKPGECTAQNGEVSHSGSGRSIAYKDLVEAAATQEIPAEIALKKESEFKLIGKVIARLDVPEKVEGTALFGMDITLPGMLTAVIARPPVLGGSLKSFDDTAAKKIPGVRHVVAIDRGVAVVADGFWAASQGRDDLSIDWEDGPLAGFDSDEQTKEYAKIAELPGLPAADRGDIETALQQADKTVEAVYELPYLAHAPMEPLNCVADVRNDGCDLYTGSQFQTVDRNNAAAAAGLPPEKVKLHNTYLGGGFGRRAVIDSHHIVEAVQVSKAVGVPVKVIWTREDDIQGGYYRPRTYTKVQGGLDKDGNLIGLKQVIVGQSIAKGTPFEEAMIHDGVDHTSVEGAADAEYAIPHFRVEYHMAPAGVPVLWWRAVGHTFNAYVKECFIDELAQQAGKDPYQFRRTLLSNNPRELAVLDLVAEKAGWSTPPPRGLGRGIAFHTSFGSHVAMVAEITMSERGRVKVERVVCAIDCGQTVNPDTIAAQMESGIVFGLSAGFYQEITFRNGRVQQDNFDSYDLLRISEMPKVEVYIVPSKEPPGGVGEPGVPPICPAVANAIMSITGKPLHHQPFRQEELLPG